MYREEQVIDGVLCFKSHPNGSFKPYTLKQLTAKIIEAHNAGFNEGAAAAADEILNK